MRKYRITRWELPEASVMGSMWGNLKHAEWCEKTVAELEDGGVQACVETNNKGEMAVFRLLSTGVQS